YYGREVSGPAYPWCCVFLWWLFQEAGLAALFYGGGKTASCGALCRYAKAHGQYVERAYQPGDLAFFCFSGDTIQHIGLVERAAADGTLVTIEGNTGPGNDANGGQVQRRRRSPQCVRGAYRPDYEEETMTQTQFNAMMDAWLQERAAEEPGNFSAQARAWAEGEGLILGDEAGRKQYRSFCTREQLMTFLYRFKAMKE
ncbi:MAG: CHAP domain-containing protein, partial [Oscillibacter sp.]